MIKSAHYFLYSLVLLLLLSCGGTPPKPLPEPLQTARQHEYRASMAFQQGHYHSAIRQYQLALSLYRAIDDIPRQAQTHINLTQTALLINQTSLAKTQLNILNELIEFGALESLHTRWQLLHSEYLLRTDQTEQAFADLTELISQGSYPLEQNLRQATSINLAIAAIRLGRPGAVDYLKQAEKQNNDNPLLKARFLRLHALLAQKQQNFATAELSYNAALQYYREKLFQPGIAATLTELGKLSLLQQDTKKARYHFDRALAIRLHIYDHRSADKLLSQLIKLEQTLGNQDAATQYKMQKQHLETATNNR